MGGSGRNVQRLLHVRKAEVICEVCDLLQKGVGEQDLLVVFEFLLPIPNVQNPLIMVRVVKQALVV